MEIRWLHEHGLVANYDDYAELPLRVLMDARLLMEAEAAADRKATRNG